MNLSFVSRTPVPLGWNKLMLPASDFSLTWLLSGSAVFLFGNILSTVSLEAVDWILVVAMRLALACFLALLFFVCSITNQQHCFFGSSGLDFGCCHKGSFWLSRLARLFCLFPNGMSKDVAKEFF